MAKEEGKKKKKKWRFLKLEQMQEEPEEQKLMPENDLIETTAFEGITVRERERRFGGLDYRRGVCERETLETGLCVFLWVEKKRFEMN